MSTQGKCLKCKVGVRFDHPARLKDAYCARCGTKLRATTHLLKWPWEYQAYCFKPTKKAGA
jgi:uncharacterized paraquat-inducible protein A